MKKNLLICLVIMQQQLNGDPFSFKEILSLDFASLKSSYRCFSKIEVIEAFTVTSSDLVYVDDQDRKDVLGLANRCFTKEQLIGEVEGLVNRHIHRIPNNLAEDSIYRYFLLRYLNRSMGKLLSSYTSNLSV